MKIYLVEDCANSPGRILACFKYEIDAVRFAEAQPDATAVEERTLFHIVPDASCGGNAVGYNP